MLEEHEQVSHSVSADAACLRAMEMGASTALLVPIDVPTVTPADFTALAGVAGLVADRHEQRVNAVRLRPDVELDEHDRQATPS